MDSRLPESDAGIFISVTLELIGMHMTCVFATSFLSGS